MTFTEFFKQLDIEDSLFGAYGYILDAPDALFNTMKDELAASFLQEFQTDKLLRQISENDDLDIFQIKSEIVEAYNLISEAFNSEDVDLPQDRKEYFLDLVAAVRDRCLELPERKIVEIVYEKIDDDVILPTYAHSTDAGADVYANEEVEIAGNATVIVKTGLRVAIPVGWELQIRPRSGMSLKTPIRIANAPGTIDAGYRNEVGIICHNTSPYPYTIHKGDRIAQFIPTLCPMINWIEGKVSEIGEDRQGGFGSTGE